MRCRPTRKKLSPIRSTSRCAPTPTSSRANTSSRSNTPYEDETAEHAKTAEKISRRSQRSLRFLPSSPADRLAGELLVEPLRQRCEVIEDRRRVHLLRSGQ